jgi:predicted O-linked N-acetylglucosamine transferase (SPINDLY family)
MQTAVAALPPIHAASPEPETLLAAARDGRMSLQELMSQAQALQGAGQIEAAAQLYEAWINGTESPMRPVACFNWGTLLSTAGQEPAAEAAYRRALDLQPGFAPALLNLGHLLERRGAVDAALATWREVFDADPPPALEHRLHALNNGARLLENVRRYPEAEALMRRSLEIKDAQLDVIQHYVHIRQKQCAWPVYQPVGEVGPTSLLQGTSLLAMMGLSRRPGAATAVGGALRRRAVPKPQAVPLHTQTMPPRSGRSASATCRATCTCTPWAC